MINGYDITLQNALIMVLTPNTFAELNDILPNAVPMSKIIPVDSSSQSNLTEKIFCDGLAIGLAKRS